MSDYRKHLLRLEASLSLFFNGIITGSALAISLVVALWYFFGIYLKTEVI